MESREQFWVLAMSVLLVDMDGVADDGGLVCRSVVEVARGFQDAVWDRLEALGEEAVRDSSVRCAPFDKLRAGCSE